MMEDRGGISLRASETGPTPWTQYASGWAVEQLHRCFLMPACLSRATSGGRPEGTNDGRQQRRGWSR